MTSILPKTRIIPIGDFYTRLQLEYICYKFRSMIYSRSFDKKKFTDICEKKRQKIDQIALENRLPSIFNNEEQQKRYFTRFFEEQGCPNFCYRDDYQRQVKGFWDTYYYFVEGSSVRVQIKDKFEIGKIVKVDIEKETLMVEVDGSEINVKFRDVVRIFPSDFFGKLFK